MPDRRRTAAPARRSGTLVLAAAAIALVAAACAAPGAGPSPAPASTAAARRDATFTAQPTPAPAAPAPAPGELTAELRQSRADWGDRVVQVRVSSTSTHDVTVRAATLRTTTTSTLATSGPDEATTVPPGRSRELSLPLGPALCPPTAAVDGEAGLVVATGGGDVTLTLPVADPQGHLARIQGEDCAAAAVAAGLEVALDPVLVTAERDGALVGTMTLRATAVPGGPQVVLEALDASVLLHPLDGPAWPLDVTGTGTVALDVTPARCDPHAVAEDKRGTWFGLHANVDGVPQATFFVGAPDALRESLRVFVGEACGWG